MVDVLLVVWWVEGLGLGCFFKMGAWKWFEGSVGLREERDYYSRIAVGG